MLKHLIRLFALSLVALVWTDANAGCCCGGAVCAPWISGSGAPTTVATIEPTVFPTVFEACPTVFEAQGSGEGGGEIGILQVPEPIASLTLRLVGTIPTELSPECGLEDPDDQFCRIEVVAFCGDSVNRKQSTPGPLLVESPGATQKQVDGVGLDNANLSFQLSFFAKQELCPAGDFKNFLVPEGFFEACVTSLTNPLEVNCVRERCQVDMGGIGRDRPRVYNCKPV